MSTNKQRKAATATPVKEGETRVFLATAYYPAFDRMNGGLITATGRRVHSVRQAREDGNPVTIAVDPRVVPYGTIVTIKEFPGLQFIAADTGGRIRNNHIDISMTTRAECDEWGTRNVTVTIVTIPPNKKPKAEHPHKKGEKRVNR